jgi:hypothetical protein
MTKKGDEMKLKRTYKRKFWHWDIFWNALPNIFDEWNYEKIYTPKWFNKDGLDYIDSLSFWWFPDFIRERSIPFDFASN